VGGPLEGGAGGGEEGFSGDSFRRKSRRAGSRWLRGSEGLSASLEGEDPQNQPIVVELGCGRGGSCNGLW